jgi:hypothetical protein
MFDKSTLSTACVVIVALINLMPVVGVVSAGALEKMYKVLPSNSPNMGVLLRHRAVLIGIIGSPLLSSAWLAHLRTAASIAALASMSSFLVIVWLEQRANDEQRRRSEAGEDVRGRHILTHELRRVCYVDVFGIVLLLGSMCL